MSNSIRRNIKKQTNEQRVDQIARVQFEMWLKLDKISKELRKVQDIIALTDEKIKTKEDESNNTEKLEG